MNIKSLTKSKLKNVKTITQDDWIYCLKYILSTKKLTGERRDELYAMPEYGYVYLPRWVWKAFKELGHTPYLFIQK